MKAEIIADMKSGQVSTQTSSFSELHDYVDANEYGGFCEDGFIAQFGEYENDGGMPQAFMDYANAAQSAIDMWLRTTSVFF
jgi:hypothetical protein